MVGDICMIISYPINTMILYKYTSCHIKLKHHIWCKISYTMHKIRTSSRVGVPCLSPHLITYFKILACNNLPLGSVSSQRKKQSIVLILSKHLIFYFMKKFMSKISLSSHHVFMILTPKFEMIPVEILLLNSYSKITWCKLIDRDCNI